MAFADGSQAYKLEGDVYRPSRARVRARSQTKPQSRASSGRQMLDVAAICIAMLGLGVLYVAQHATMASVGDGLYQAQKSIGELKAENGQLKLQVMELSALGRVERMARGDGKMVDPGRVEYVAFAGASGSHSPSRSAVAGRRVETVSLDAQKLASPAHLTVD